MTNAIFLVVGESGSGKDTIVNRLVKLYGIKRIDSYTTRKSRGDNDRHIFVKDFVSWQIANPEEQLVGYTEFSGAQYWATASQVDSSDVYIIDPAGVRYFWNAYTGQKRVKVVYLHVPAYKRIWRMLKRGDGLIGAIKRLWHDDSQFIGAMRMADYVISDGSIDEMAAELWTYMNITEGCT